MKSPFIKATCGCVVIPLGCPGYVKNYTLCVCVVACDTRDSPAEMFSLRDFNPDVIDRGKPLAADETRELAMKIDRLVRLGHTMADVSRTLDVVKNMLEKE